MLKIDPSIIRATFSSFSCSLPGAIYEEPFLELFKFDILLLYYSFVIERTDFPSYDLTPLISG